MNRIVGLVTVMLTALSSGDAAAQSGGLYTGSQSVNSRHAVISSDLLAIYEQTKTADSEQTITAIARSCSRIIPDKARSKADRDYASSLLAWALNRRGELRSDRAAELVEQGDLVEADRLDRLASDDFATALEHAPDNWRTHHNYAISLAMQGQYTEAIGEFTTALELNPDYANAYFNRGELHFELSDFASAIEDYDQAIDRQGQDPQFFNSRGHARFMLGQYEQAVTDYRQAAELAPDSAVYQTDLADAFQFLGQWSEAATAYRNAVNVNGKYGRAYLNAAWLMATSPELQVRNLDLALAAAKKAIELSGTKTVRSLDTLAAANAAVGNHAEAVNLQRQALALATDPDERKELGERLKLYQQGRTYLQPQPSADLQPTASDTQSRIRTASGQQRSVLSRQ